MLDQTSGGRAATGRHAGWCAAALLTLAPLAACSGDAAEGGGGAASATQQATPGGDGADQPAGAPGAEPAGVDEQGDEVVLPRRTRAEVRRATDGYLDESGDALRSPDPDPDRPAYDDVTGPALESLLNTVAEYEQNGWRVVGRPRVVSQQVVRSEGRTAVVRACLDNSRVKVVDVDGRVVPNSTPRHARTLNILTLTRTKDGWAVSDQRTATRPDC